MTICLLAYTVPNISLFNINVQITRAKVIKLISACFHPFSLSIDCNKKHSDSIRARLTNNIIFGSDHAPPILTPLLKIIFQGGYFYFLEHVAGMLVIIA